MLALWALLFFLLVTFFRLIIELTMVRSIAQILLHTSEGGGAKSLSRTEPKGPLQ